ncbi:acetolactate synthase small subunit [Chondrinema litorale]|uniref:acetolactate synthase small subunit n=1 Tax=Chondrinema litorale TaxID=2994555 RepID=UPI00254387F0|nr:acetolactate synthase small subunit [Chondrinema litorale]UZR94839.1 acetolactate synthase small subunit [Chondrinema litorale]
MEIKEEEKRFTLSLFTENKIGLVNRITIIFTRRKMNILSLTTSESELKDIYRFTVVIKTTASQVAKVVKQIEKQIGVLKAFYYEEEQVIFQEIALYKIPTKALFGGETIEHIIRNHYARILTVEEEFVVIEKTGHEHETQELFEALKPFGVLGFVRSGRVAIPKPMRKVMSYLQELEDLAYSLDN